mmetsp:Transcript_5713/g.12971  ORF Transcript_5713/g.12971 Transcript_5713/m.12971 type:complete len:733 (+) Transcript_5713:57-2255(+)
MSDTQEMIGNAWESYQLNAAEADVAAASAPAPPGEDDEIDHGEEAGGDVDIPAFIDVPTLSTIDATNNDDGVKSTSFQEKWETHIESLKEFKNRHGHVNISRNHDKDLGRFVNNQRQNYRKLLEGKQSSLTVDRIQDLERLGFQWTMRPETLLMTEADAGTKMKALQDIAKAATENKCERGRAKDDETWNSRLEQLRNFNQRSGHFRVPCTDKRGTKRPRASGQLQEVDPETVKLGKWVKRQRRQYATNQLPPHRVAALEGIEFDFKPGSATKAERLEVQLGLLDTLRKSRELSNAQVQDLNFLYDEWKRRSGERVAKPVHVQKSQDVTTKFDIKWTQNFEQLKQFQIENGHTRVPQRQSAAGDSATDESRKALGKWVDYQRQSYWKRQKGMRVALNENRIASLESIGFEWRVRDMLPVPSFDSSEIANLKNDFYPSVGLGSAAQDVRIQVETDCAVEACEDEALDLSSVFGELTPIEDGQNLNDYKWSCHLEELTRYKGLFGTTIVKNKKHPVYGEQLASLSKWAARQCTLYQRRKNGEKSGLSKSRVKRLEAIDFEVKAPFGKSVNFCGWNKRLNSLKAFRTKNGHCRVPARKKKGEHDPNHDPEMQSLAKWVEHQRAMYWKRAKGEKNSLSDERIGALNAIGMEWRIVSFAGDNRFDPANELIRAPIGNQAGMKTEEEALPNNNDAAEAAELSAAHQVIDAIPDSIPNLAPAIVDVEIAVDSMEGHNEV